MSGVSCALPSPLDPQAALKKLAEVRKRRAALSPAAQERFAARELGVDVPSFRAALKGQHPMPEPTLKVPKKAKTIEDPRKHAYDSGWQASKTTKTYDMDGPEARYEAKYGRDARADFAAGWADYASDYEKYTSFIGGKAIPTPAWRTTISDSFNAADRVRIDSVLDDIAGMIGQPGSRLDHLIIRMAAEGDQYVGKGAIAYHRGGSVILSRFGFSQKFIDEALRSMKSGFHVKTIRLDGLQSTLAHEIGHHLMEGMRPQVMLKALQGLSDEVGSKLFFGDVRSVSKRMSKNRDELWPRVSRYGVDDFDAEEMYAEIWAMYVDNPNAPPWVKQFGDTIIAEIRRTL